MREDQIQLVAFRNAELDSEHLRIFGVIDFFAIFMLITVVRVFVIRTASGTTSWRSLLLAIVVIGYELWMLSKETREALIGLGIRVDVMDTGNAAAAYNLLATERGVDEVGAALLPVGWKGR